MRQLWDIALKDLLIVAKDRGAWMLLLITPLVVIVIASFALAPAFEGGGSLNAKLLLTNNDAGEVSQSLIAALKSNEQITVVNAGTAESEALEQEGNKYKVSLIIPPDFSQRVQAGATTDLALYVDPSDNVVRPFLVGMIQGIASRISAVEVAAKVSVAEAIKLDKRADIAAVAGSAAASAAQQMSDEPVKTTIINAGAQEEINAFDTQVPGYSVMFLLFGVLTAAEGLLVERESGTMGRLLVAPVAKASILGGKLAAQFLVGLIQVSLLFAVGHFVFGMNVGSSLAGLALMIILTAYAATAFGILLASLAKTRRQVSAVGVLGVLLMSALGGSWWPLEIVPDFMKTIGHLTINAWALDGLNDLIIRSLGLTAILPEALVLLAYGSICFVIGISMFRFHNA